jgi:hypothetical protein
MSYGAWVCAAAALGACNFVYGLDGTRLANGSPRALVFDNSASGTDLVDFQLLVAPDGSFDFTDVTDPERNIRFVDPRTEVDLPFEIERWDPSGGSLFWVRVPRITARSTTDHIEMHFGATVAGTRDPDVWRDYDLVVHAPRDGIVASAVGTYTGRGTAPITATSGAVGDAIAMPNTITFESSGALLNGWDKYTLEFWIYADYATIPALVQNTPPIQMGVLDRGGSINLGRLIQYQIPDILRMQIDTHYDAGDLYLSSFVQLQRWLYIVFTFDGQAQWVYRDGAFAAVDGYASGAKLIAGANLLRLGAGVSNTMKGGIDELRLSRVGRNDDWVNAQYLSMTGRFITYSP